MVTKNTHIINLIRFYAENNDVEFRKEAYKIASEFDKLGETDLSEYIIMLLSNTNAWVPQEIREVKGEEE